MPGGFRKKCFAMEKHIKSESQIKTKLLLSTAVILILISSILYFAFSSFQKLTQSSDALARPNLRIVLLHDMVSSIYQAESNIRSYTLTQEDKHLDAYFNELSAINELVDSLNILAGDDPFFFQTIDSINTQLVNKTRLLEELIELKRQDPASVFYEQVIEEISQVAEAPLPERGIAQGPATQLSTDTLAHSQEEIRQQKTNFFARLRNLFSGRQASEKLREDLSPMEESAPAAASLQPAEDPADLTESRDPEGLKKTIENTLTSLNQSRLENLQHLQRLENSILLEDKIVMDRIWEYVTILEDYERFNAAGLAETAHTTVFKTTQKIFYSIVASLVVLLILTWLLINDINRSRFYKKQLLQAKEKAEQLVQAKQRFMASISHEIRTPLNSIIGFSNQLKKIRLAKDQKSYVNAIHQSSAHLLDIVNEILDFSRMEAGKITLEPEPVNLVNLATEVYQTLTVIAKEKGLDFSLETSQCKHPDVMADPIRMKQIMLNIAGNAIKFTNEGSVRIDLADAFYEDHSGFNQVYVRVIDTGIGIAESDQRLIFEEFSRGNHEGTHKQKGTGLGLSITKKLVETMGGRIELLSEPGKGSTFVVHLPLPVAEPTAESPVLPPAEIPATLDARILLVDDDKLNHLLMKSFFKPIKGVSFFDAEDPEEALKLMNNQKFDLIITDMQMPGLSGVEMIRHLRANTSAINARTPVLVCTADITAENLEEIKESGIEDFLVKPINETLLLNKVRCLLPLSGQTSNTEGRQKEEGENLHRDEEQKSEEKLYDLEGLIAFTSNDPESMVPVIEVFIKDTRVNLLKLEDFLEKGDRESLFLVAHKMSNMFGLLKAEQVISYLEKINRMKNGEAKNEELREIVSGLIMAGRSVIGLLADDLKEIVTGQGQVSSKT